MQAGYKASHDVFAVCRSMEGRHEGEYSELLESYQTLPCAEVPVILHDKVLMAMFVLLRNT